MKDWIVVVPFIGPDWVIDGLLEQVEVDLFGRFLFIDNTPTGSLKDSSRHRLHIYGAEVVHRPENAGFAGSVNLGLRRGHEQTIVCSASVRFPAGFRRWLEEASAAVTPMGLFTLLSWHLLSLGRPLVERLGYLDENFYPCELEDIDYMWRMIVAGSLHDEDQGGVGRPRPMSCSRAGLNLSTADHRFKQNGPALSAYYDRKWGGHPEVFRAPFDNAANPLGYWPPATVGELKRRYGV